MTYTISEEDFYRIWGNYEGNTNMDFSKIVLKKIEILGTLLNSIYEDEIQMPEMYVWTEPLLLKLIFHANTITSLFSGTIVRIDNKEIKIFDEPSIISLFRVMLENYLTFNFLYIDEVSDQEKEFRYMVWKYSGIKQRTNFNATIPINIDKKNSEIEICDQMLKWISNSSYFHGYKSNEQNQIKDGRKPRLFNTWKELIKKSNFNSRILKDLYSIKSSYAHSEFISIAQIKSRNYSFNQSDRENTILFLTHIIICRCICELSNIYPSIKSRLKKIEKNDLIEIEYLNWFSKYEMEKSGASVPL